MPVWKASSKSQCFHEWADPTSDAEAIVLSCTDMRSVEVVEQIEGALGKPVVTSNQAMMFALCQKLGLSRHERLPGCLFEML